jgi:hypothetical protein
MDTTEAIIYSQIPIAIGTLLIAYEIRKMRIEIQRGKK